jgi:hypothetical protein
MRALVIVLACACASALQLPQAAYSRRAAIGAVVAAVPTAASAAVTENPYAQKGGFSQPINSKTGQLYGGVVVNNNALSAVFGLFGGLFAMGAVMAEAAKPRGPDGCLISPTDDKEYCGALNEDESCVWNGIDGWVCA